MSCGAAPAPTAAPPSLPRNSGKKKTSSAQNPGRDEAASAAAAAAAATAPSNSNDEQASLNYLAQLRSASALLEAVIDALQTATQVRPSVQSVEAM